MPSARPSRGQAPEAARAAGAGAPAPPQRRHHAQPDYPGGQVMHFRAAACTGALYHIDVYLVCGDLPGLAAGVYHFGPHDFALRRLRAGDIARRAGRRERRRTARRGGAGAAGVHVDVLAQRLEVSGARLSPLLLGLRHDARQPAWRWPRPTASRRSVVLGFADAPVNQLARPGHASARSRWPLVALGQRRAPPPPSRRWHRWPSRSSRCLQHEVDYPLIRAAHAASSLPDGGRRARLARRRGRRRRAHRQAWREPRALQLPAARPRRSTLDAVIRGAVRRGGSRARRSRSRRCRRMLQVRDRRRSRWTSPRVARRTLPHRQRRRRPGGGRLRVRRARRTLHCWRSATSAAMPAISTSARSLPPTRRSTSISWPTSSAPAPPRRARLPGRAARGAPIAGGRLYLGRLRARPRRHRPDVLRRRRHRLLLAVRCRARDVMFLHRRGPPGAPRPRLRQRLRLDPVARDSSCSRATVRPALTALPLRW